MAWLVYSHRGVAKRLVLDIEPAGARAGVAFDTQPVGHLVDGSGLPSRAAGVTVTASKTAGSGTLGGTLTALTDDEGVFAFSDLSMSAVAGGVTLQFASGALVAVECASFNVTASGYVLAGEAASYAWSGSAVTLGYGRRLTAGLAAYAWSPATATLRSGRRLTATTRAYAWTGSAATLTHGGGTPTLNAYFNSSEAGGDGSDANVILADDFSRGWWYRKDGDHCSFGSGLSGQGTEAGWGGTIYYGVDESGNVGDGGAIATDNAIFSSYAAYFGQHDGSTGGTYMAEHNFATPVDEFWMRYYIKWDTGYSFGAEKTIGSINKTVGDGIYFGNMHLNLGSGSASSNGQLYWQAVGSGTTINTGFSMTGNLHWNCIILHCKLSSGNNTPDGVVEIWADDCGLDGLSGPGTPTLRGQVTNYAFPHLAGDHFGAIWAESWANPASNGKHWWKNLMIRTDHSPGFRTA